MESEQIILGGPVRLFVPYKRRKKDGDPPVIPPKKEIPKSLTLPPGTFTVTPSGELTATTGTLSFEHSTSEEPSALDTPSEVFANATVLTALPSLGVAPQSVQGKVPLSAASSLQGAGLTLEVSPVGGVSPSGSQVDKSTWMYLEDMANTLLSNVQQLKSLIEQAKQGALMGKECRRECSLNQSFESQMGFSHSDDSDPKRSSDLNEIIMNMCVNCGRVAITECTACHKASYCSNFCQRKDWKDHQLICTGAVHDEDPMQLQCSESQK
uniref:MYND-type domain-containing protein n=1 Tax=Knipowitschia caucasica TaxID=637954 RepID=A0AAV2L1G6_KNICA